MLAASSSLESYAARCDWDQSGPLPTPCVFYTPQPSVNLRFVWVPKCPLAPLDLWTLISWQWNEIITRIKTKIASCSRRLCQAQPPLSCRSRWALLPPRHAHSTWFTRPESCKGIRGSFICLFPRVGGDPYTAFKASSGWGKQKKNVLLLESFAHSTGQGLGTSCIKLHQFIRSPISFVIDELIQS